MISTLYLKVYTQWVMVAVGYPRLKVSENSQSEGHTKNIYIDMPLIVTLTAALGRHQEAMLE